MKIKKEEIERHERLTEQRIDRYFSENEQKTDIMELRLYTRRIQWKTW